MKNWFRILGLASVLVLANLAAAKAEFPQYGACSAWCGGTQYILSNVTRGQCCSNVNNFGNNCYSVGWEWYPYGEGDSLVCEG